MKKSIVLFVFLLAAFAWTAPEKTDVLCIYYPEWHVYPEGEAIFGKGRTEWDYVDSAKPRFPGHEQPLKLKDGHPDDANPADVAKEIDYAADAGIDCFVRSVAIAKRQAESDPKKPGAILINAWNEYTEGSYLMPDEKNGDAYLKALRRALGALPKANSLGVVAHVTWRDFSERDRAFAMMRAAGIGYVRSDFHLWRCVPRKAGDKWDFSMYDQVLASAERYGIQILPILANFPEWGKDDFAKHERGWVNFVRETVRHFKGRIPYYEVCNEPNLEMFWNNPNPANYLAALKAAYRTIKAEDPRAKVVISGFAGVPLDFIGRIYALGGKDFFDVMNVHPYTWPNPPKGALEPMLDGLKGLMAKHGDAAKPVWITEMGWPTHRAMLPAQNLFLAGLKAARPEQKTWRVGYVDSSDKVERGRIYAEAMAEILPKGSVAKSYAAAELNAALASDALDAVVYPFDESFPLDTFESVVQFVKKGGVLVDFGGCPMWSPVRRGEVVERNAEGALLRGIARNRLRLDVVWPNGENGLSANARTFATEAADRAGLKPDPNGFPCFRFFTGALLKPGDECVPLTTVKDKRGRELAGVCVYRFNSDFKGAVVVAGCGNDRGGTSEQDQAAYLRQAMDISFARGIEKFFIYEFRAPEKDPYYSEDHFGIVHHDFIPKAAYVELTCEGGLGLKVRQPFVSARPVWAKGSEREQNVFLRFRSSFACPDGRVPVLRVAASSIYRVKLNGRFAGCGPARTSKGYASVDEWTLSAVSNGVNDVEIDVCSYNVPESFQYLAEPGFLQAEIVADGKALVATPADFAATVLPRSTAQPFYSHQRKIPVERWTVAAEEKERGVEVVPAPKLLPRMAPYPVFRVRSAQRREGADGLAYDFPFVDTGFPGVKVCCRKPGRITLRFEEALTAGRLNLHRNGDPATSWHAMHNFVTWDVVKPGVYELESIEPYSMKHVEVSFENDCGRLLSAPWIRQYRNPHLEQVAFHSSDPEIDAIFAAACNSLAMNAVDLYTDCPSRERSAWLCDSHFTAMAADWLTGDNSIEGSQLENFARTTDYPGLPPGGMSGLYPGNRLLPTYMMWYVLQCAEHVARAGADAERFKEAVRERVLANVAFLRKFENADGLLENLPGWIFVEWSKANDFTTGVNYPVNALWSAALESAGRIFARPDLVKKADAVRGTIRRQSFDGRYFRDHALRDAQGALTVKDEKSETCQYYQFCFGVVSRDSHPELWDRMATGFGPGKTSDGLQPSDMFFGQLLRLDLLGRYGRYEQELAEIRHYFGKMAKESGALWEFADGHDSRCHGFGSFVSVLLLRDILGVKEINSSDKYVSVSSASAPIKNATATVRTADGPLTFRLSRSGERSLRDASLPSGWTLRRLDVGKASDADIRNVNIVGNGAGLGPFPARL